MYVHITTVMNWQTRWSPRPLTVVSTRKLEKLALNSGTTEGARKNDAKCVKKTRHRRHKTTVESRSPVSVASWNVHRIRDDLNLGHFPPTRMITGTYTTVDELRKTSTMGTCRCTQRACKRQGPEKRAANCGISIVSSRRAPELQDLHNHDDHRINRLQLGKSLWSAARDQGNVLCVMTG